MSDPGSAARGRLSELQLKYPEHTLAQEGESLFTATRADGEEGKPLAARSPQELEVMLAAQAWQELTGCCRYLPDPGEGE